MELPVAKQSYLPTPEAMVRAAKRAGVVLARTVAQESALDGAVAFANPARPGVGLANFAADVALLPAGGGGESGGWSGGGSGGAVVDAVLDHFRAAGAPCAWMDCPAMDWPADLARELESRGFRPAQRHVFLLQGYTPPTRANESVQIIPARAAYAQARELFLLMARDEYGATGPTEAATWADTMIDQLDEQRLDFFLARLDGQPVGCAGVLTLGQIGVIQPAYADPSRRGQGIGAALMAHMIEHCRRALFEQVLLEREDGCPTIPFYQGLGFKPVGRYVRYLSP